MSEEHGVSRRSLCFANLGHDKHDWFARVLSTIDVHDDFERIAWTIDTEDQGIGRIESIFMVLSVHLQVLKQSFFTECDQWSIGGDMLRSRNAALIYKYDEISWNEPVIVMLHAKFWTTWIWSDAVAAKFGTIGIPFCLHTVVIRLSFRTLVLWPKSCIAIAVSMGLTIISERRFMFLQTFVIVTLCLNIRKLTLVVLV